MALNLDRRRVGAGLALFGVAFAIRAAVVEHATVIRNAGTGDATLTPVESVLSSPEPLPQIFPTIFVVGAALLMLVGIWQLLSESDTRAKLIAIGTGFVLLGNELALVLERRWSSLTISESGTTSFHVTYRAGVSYGIVTAVLAVVAGLVLPPGHGSGSHVVGAEPDSAVSEN